PAYQISLTFYHADHRAVGRYLDSGASLGPRPLRRVASLSSHTLYQTYQEGGGALGVPVAPVRRLREPDSYDYGCITREDAPDSEEVVGWVTVRAEPEPVVREGGMPFPRVLIPSGSYDAVYMEMAVAEFRDGVLVRTMGRDFGRFRLPEEVAQALAAESSIWRTERVEEIGRAHV